MITQERLDAARARAETTLTDTITFTRPGSGEGTFDPVTGTHTTPAPTIVWWGPCSIGPLATGNVVIRDGQVRAGDESVIRLPVVGTNPAGLVTSSIRRGDVGVITAHTGGDQAVDDMPYHVTEIDRRTTAVLRRLVVIEVGRTQGTG